MVIEKGINRALESVCKKREFKGDIDSKQASKSCVFISHKSSDEKAAKAVAEYLMLNNIDIYLDKKDEGLQKKIQEVDTEGIVASIDEALKYCTHILVLVSDETKKSWWVPYEIGYSKKGEKKIASALLKSNNEDFPDYLKIERIIKNYCDFKNYVAEVQRSKYGALFNKKESKLVEPIKLKEYIRSEDNE